MDDKNRSVTPLLGFGIFFMPYIFGWLVFRDGYSRNARIISVVWMVVVLALVAGNKNSNEQRTNSPAKVGAADAKESSERTTENSLGKFTGLIGTHPSNVIESAELKAAFVKLLGTSQKDFISRLDVASDTERKGEWMVGSGNAAHAGGTDEAAFAVNLNSGKVFAAMLVSGNNIKTFGADTATKLPPPLLAWYQERSGQVASSSTEISTERPGGSATAPNIANYQKLLVGTWSCLNVKQMSDERILRLKPDGSLVSVKGIYGQKPSEANASVGGWAIDQKTLKRLHMSSSSMTSINAGNPLRISEEADVDFDTPQSFVLIENSGLRMCNPAR